MAQTPSKASERSLTRIAMQFLVDDFQALDIGFDDGFDFGFALSLSREVVGVHHFDGDFQMGGGADIGDVASADDDDDFVHGCSPK